MNPLEAIKMPVFGRMFKSFFIEHTKNYEALKFTQLGREIIKERQTSTLGHLLQHNRCELLK